MFAILENFCESVPFILELISRKIKRWSLTHVNFFVARDCNYRDEKFCDVSKADSLHCSEALGGFWSFNVQKGKISNGDAIANHETAMNIQVQANNTLTADTDDQKFNCDNADGQSQTGDRKKMSGRWIRKTNRENKGYEKHLETLFTHRWSNIYLHKLPFIVDLTDIKSWIVLKFR